jgi:NAD-dependent deacetylase
MPNTIFVLTGAGISAESGLGTFRDKQGEGIWAKFDPMKLATPEAFARDPEAVLAFYNLRRRNLLSAKPNAAHFALARLERALAERGGSLALVTQNIDDLHERAGSRRVIHMHGELRRRAAAAATRFARGSMILRSRAPVRSADAPERCVRMWCGLARCRSTWT